MAYVPGRGLADLVARVEGAAKALQRAKGAGWTVDDVALDKLRWLERSGRDFRKVTPALSRTVNVTVPFVAGSLTTLVRAQRLSRAAEVAPFGLRAW